MAQLQPIWIGHVQLIEERISKVLEGYRTTALTVSEREFEELKRRVSSTWKDDDMDMYDMFYQM